MSLGTSYERLDYETAGELVAHLSSHPTRCTLPGLFALAKLTTATSPAGRTSGLESLANVESHKEHRQGQIPAILLPAFIAQRQGTS